jgi:hypothetical protein
MYSLCPEIDVFHRGGPIVDAVVELASPRANYVLGVGEPERDEQQSGLEDVAVVLIDHDYGCLVEGVDLPQTVGGQCPAGPPAQDDDVMHAQTPILSVPA